VMFTCKYMGIPSELWLGNCDRQVYKWEMAENEITDVSRCTTGMAI
jgi:hypothetical protein